MFPFYRTVSESGESVRFEAVHRPITENNNRSQSASGMLLLIAVFLAGSPSNYHFKLEISLTRFEFKFRL